MQTQPRKERLLHTPANRPRNGRQGVKPLSEGMKSRIGRGPYARNGERGKEEGGAMGLQPPGQSQKDGRSQMILRQEAEHAPEEKTIGKLIG
jgi:hypothetical protein